MKGFLLLTPVFKVAGAIGLLLIMPVTFASGKVQANDAYADGTCCPEYRSICNIGGGDNQNYYKKACDGSCVTKCPEPQ